MKIHLFSIHDKKSNTYQNVFTSDSPANAIRQFGSIVKEGKSMISNYPEDFSLRHIGTFHQEAGTLTSITENPTLAEAVEFSSSAK